MYLFIWNTHGYFEVYNLMDVLSSFSVWYTTVAKVLFFVLKSGNNLGHAIFYYEMSATGKLLCLIARTIAAKSKSNEIWQRQLILLQTIVNEDKIQCAKMHQYKFMDTPNYIQKIILLIDCTKYYSSKCNFFADEDNVASWWTPSRRLVNSPWMNGADMAEGCPYASFAKFWIAALANPPWMNGAAMVEEDPYTSFVKFGIVLETSMLPALISCIKQYEIVRKNM